MNRSMFFSPIFIIISSILILSSLVKGDFAAHQYILVSNVTSYVNVSSLSQFTCGLPDQYNTTFSRVLALAGYRLAYQNEVQFAIQLASYVSSTTAQIYVIAAQGTYFMKISCYIIFVKMPSQWIWVTTGNLGRTATSINETTSASDIETFMVPSPAATLMSPTTDYLIMPFLTGMKFTGVTDSALGCKIQVSTVAGSSFNLKITKNNGNSLKLVMFTAIVVNKIKMALAAYARKATVQILDITNTINTAPFNFGIDAIFRQQIELLGGGSYFSFDKYCLNGLYGITFGASDTMEVRSIMFDARSDPFSDAQSVIPLQSDSSLQQFEGIWYTFCARTCPIRTFINNAINLCDPCIVNCDVCSGSSTCTICTPPNVPGPNYTSCNTCIYFTTTCTSCLNYAYCLTCITQAYGINLITHLCDPCDQMITNCIKCINSNYCTQCNTTYFSSADNSVCLSCSAFIPNCVTCDSSSACTQCISDEYYIDPYGTTGQCEPCSSITTYCTHCGVYLGTGLSYTYCTTCQDTYYLTPYQTCAPCSGIPGCQLCDNGTYCLTCYNPLQVYSTLSNACVACSVLFPGCANCTQSNCNQCQNGFVFVNGNCSCAVGWSVGSQCTNIYGCTLLQTLPDGTQMCLACDTSQFHPTPVNGLCECLQGQSINGVCFESQGCIATVTVNGTVRCAFCNVTAKLILNSNFECVCKEKYELVNGICEDICGDGFLMDFSNRFNCDDGNRIDGDGCDSQCTVETGYRCYNGTVMTPSQCVYEGQPLSLSLKRIERTQGMNQGIFQFTLSPALSGVSQMDLYQHLSLNCDSTYTIADISYEGGVFQVVADYTTDMQGYNCRLTLSYDPSVARLPVSYLDFSAISDNSPLLVISFKLSELATIQLIFGIIAYIVLALFFLSLPTSKMLGPQLLLSSQIVYLSNAFYQRPSFLFSAVSNLNLVNGLWETYYEKERDKDLVYPFTGRVKMTGEFLQNSFVVVAVITVVFVIWSAVLLLHAYRRNQTQNGITKNSFKENRQDRKKSQTKTNLRYPRLQAAIRHIYCMLLFPIGVGFICVLSIATFIQGLRLQDEKEGVYGSYMSAFSLLVTWFILGVIFGVQIFTKVQNLQIDEDKRLRGVRYGKTWYIPLFLAKMTVLNIILSFGASITFSYLIYPLLILLLAYYVFLLIYKPYTRVMFNISVFFTEIPPLYACLLSLLPSFVSVEETTQMFMLMILEGLMLIMIALGIVRLIIDYRDTIRNCLFSNKDEQKVDFADEVQVQRKKRWEAVDEERERVEVQMLRQNPYQIYRINNPNILAPRGPVTPIDRRLRPNIDMKSVLLTENGKSETDQDPNLLGIKSRLKDNLLIKKIKQKRVNIQNV